MSTLAKDVKADEEGKEDKHLEQKKAQDEQEKIQKQKLIDGQLSTKETSCYCAQLVITIILVVALFQDHRIQDGFEIIEGLNDFFGMKSINSTNLISFNDIFNTYVSTGISNIYNSKNQNLTITYNPQKYKTLQDIYDARVQYQSKEQKIQFLRTFNLFLGMRIRLDLRIIDNNQFVEDFFQILKKKRLLIIEPGGLEDQQAKIEIVKKVNKDNLVETDSYIDIYLTSELEIGRVQQILEYLQIQMSSESTYKITLDFFSINLVREIIIQQTRTFTETDQGTIEYVADDQVAIFFEISKNTNPAKTLYMSYLIKIFYLCCVSLQILISFVLVRYLFKLSIFDQQNNQKSLSFIIKKKKILGMIVNFITTKIFIFDKYIIINLILQSVVVTYLSDWLGLFAEFDQLPLSTFQSFDDFDKYNHFIKIYNQDRFFSIVVLTIQTIQLVQLINQKIPSFNIIYYSLRNSSRDLFLLMIFVIVMLVAFSVVGTLIFSSSFVPLYSKTEGTLLQLFKFIFEIGMIKELDDISQGAGIAFGLIFLIFFNFILIPYFYSVIIVIYNSMREAMSITTEAITAIESEKQFEFMKKIYDLVTFASPQAVIQKKKQEIEKKRQKELGIKDKNSIENTSVQGGTTTNRSPAKRLKTGIGLGGFQSQIENNSIMNKSIQNSPFKNHGGITPLSGDRTRQNNLPILQKSSLRGSQIFDADNSFNRKNSRSQTMLNGSGIYRKQTQYNGQHGVEDKQMLVQGAEAKMKWKQKLFYNFKQLGINLYGFIPTKVEVQTRQQRQDEIVQKIDELKAEKKKLRDYNSLKRAKTARENIKLTCIHIVFLIILIFMATGQLMYENCYQINQSLENYYQNTKFEVLDGLQKQNLDLDSVQEINHLYQWIEKVFLPPLTPLFSQNQFIDRIDQYNLVFSKFPARMSVRRAVMHENTDFSALNVTNSKMEKISLFVQKDGDMESQHSYSDEYKQDFYGPITLQEYYYIPSGSQVTPYQKGGFMQYFTTQEASNLLNLQYISKDQVINHDTGSVTLESIFYNSYYNLYTIVTISFEINSSGYIKKQIFINVNNSNQTSITIYFYYIKENKYFSENIFLFKINLLQQKSFAIDLYNSDRRIRLVWEILFFLQILIYFWQFKRDFSEIYVREDAKELTPFDPELEGNYFLYMLNYKIEEGEYSIVGLVKQILVRTFEFAHRILYTLKVYCQKTTANIFLIVGQILALIVIIFYLQYVTDSDRANFDRNDSDSFKLIGQFSNFSEQISKYSDIMSVLMFVQFMRILFYFGFSAKLALVLDVIANANLDVFFFLIIFFILLSAFALISIVLFGSSITEFQNFSNAIIMLLNWLSGVGTFPTKNVYASATEYIFYILFLVLMQLILMRMFIAILDGYFIQKISDKDDQTKGIFDLLLDILRKYYEDIRNNSIEKVEAPPQHMIDDEEIKQNKSKFKCKFQFIIKAKEAAWRYFNKLLLFFLQIYFSEEETEKMEKMIGQGKEEEGMKLNINFKESAQSDLSDSISEVDARLEDLNYYWKNDKNNVQNTQKSILEKKDKSSINFWMMLLTDSLASATNKQIDFTTYDQKGNTLYLNEQNIININADQQLENNPQAGAGAGAIGTATQLHHIIYEPNDNLKKESAITNNKQISAIQNNQSAIKVIDKYETPLVQLGETEQKKDLQKIKKRNRNIHIEYTQEWRQLFDSQIINEVIESLSQKIIVIDSKNKKKKQNYF